MTDLKGVSPQVGQWQSPFKGKIATTRLKNSMNPKLPELLLVFYILFLPKSNALVAPILLGQIHAIHATRRAEKALETSLDELNENSDLEGSNPDNPNADSTPDRELTDNALKDFLLSFWFDSTNTAAYGYLGLLVPYFLLGPGATAISPSTGSFNGTGN